MMTPGKAHTKPLALLWLVVLSAQLRGIARASDVDPCYVLYEAARYYISLEEGRPAKNALADLDSARCAPYRRHIELLRAQTEHLPEYNYYVQRVFTLAPFYNQTSFSSTASKSGLTNYGLFISYSYYPTVIEVAGDVLLIKLTTTSTPIAQVTGAAAISHSGESGGLRVAVLYLKSTDSTAGTGVVGTIGAKKFETAEYEIGMDGHFSYYPALTSQPLYVGQLSPYAALFFLNGFYARVNGFLGKPFGNTESALTNAVAGAVVLPSGELVLGYENRSFFANVSGWLGTQVFGVRNGGFVVFNSTERRLGGFGAQLGLFLTSSVVARVNYSMENIDNKTSGKTYLASGVTGILGVTF